MDSKDTQLYAKIEQSYESLQKAYGYIDKERIKTRKPSNKKNIHLELRTFEALIDEAKEEVEENEIEDIENILQIVYHIDVKEDYVVHIKAKVDELNTRYLSTTKENKSVNEEMLQSYRVDILLVDAIINAIENRMYQLEHGKRWFHFSHDKVMKHYQQSLENFQKLRNNMVGCFELMSRMVTSYIVESFHYLYLFFVYTIKFLVTKGEQMLLIEIAATIERYKKVLKPLRETGGLEKGVLKNSYMIQEFSDLQTVVKNHA